MRDDDMTHGAYLSRRKREPYAAGVNRQPFVDDE
jgi:hypothetical protein